MTTNAGILTHMVASTTVVVQILSTKSLNTSATDWTRLSYYSSKVDLCNCYKILICSLFVGLLDLDICSWSFIRSRANQTACCLLMIWISLTFTCLVLSTSKSAVAESPEALQHFGRQTRTLQSAAIDFYLTCMIYSVMILLNCWKICQRPPTEFAL